MSSTSSFSVGEETQLDRGGVDQRVGPTELQRVDAFLEAHFAGFADQGEVFGVVDGQLHGGAVGHRGEVDVALPGALSPDAAGKAAHQDVRK